MKFSYNWLAELVEGLDTDPRELSQLITMKTAEAEGVETYAPWLAGVRAARVLSAERIGSGKNQKATVDLGGGITRTVVCGAPNCRPGVVTAYVPPGTRLGAREIGRATIGGVESEGMLASGAELGISRDAEGILELNLEPGAPLGLAADHVIEIDNKSLTHRPDLWGHYGMAREVAAISGRPLRDPVRMDLLPEGPSPVKVEIADHQLCPRYSALVFDNVKVQPSPLWLQYRLEAIGLNPINNIVDVTNLIMAELAQPMHAFDAAKLAGDTIFVRPARPNELCEALNGEAYNLSHANLVIADAKGPVAIAGVIGGAWSAISESTTRIVFESANFQASSVRKTSASLKLRTDASMRFEKAQDPVNTTRALARAVELLRCVSPGIEVVGGVADNRAPAAPLPVIELPLEWLHRKLGRHVDPAEVGSILRSLGFTVSSAGGALTVTVPTWRATKDISIKDDLVEEIGRIIGYGSITPVPPEVAVTVPPHNHEREYHHHVRELTAAQGFTEVYNYSFISDAAAAELGLDPAEHIRLLNPIAEDQNLMRTSLLPGILRNIRDNARFFETFRLFELGFEIHKQAAGLPREVPHLCAAMYAKSDAGQIFELKRLAECLAPGATVGSAGACPYEHPARAANVIYGGETVGRLLELHPSVLDQGRAAVLDLDLAALHRLLPHDRRFQPIRRFPSSAFDLSVVAGARELVGAIEEQLRSFAGVGMERIEYVRQYQGPPLPEGKKSVSFRLTVSAPDRTLSSDEVGQFRAQLIQAMRSAGYDLRV